MNRTPETAQHPDPLIDEVREIRRTISDEHGGDVGRLCDHLRDVVQHRYASRVVTRPRPAAPAGGTPSPG